MNRFPRSLCAALQIAVAIAFVASTPASQNPSTEEFLQTYELAPGAVVSVSNTSGQITISAWNQNRAEIRAIKRAHGPREDLARVRIDVSHSPMRLEVRTIYESGRSNVDVQYEIRVPANVHIESASSVSGDVSVSRIGGRVVVTTTSGNLKVSGISETAKLHSVSGLVEVSGIGGRLDVSTSSGDVHTRDTEAISVQTVSGGVTLRNGTGRAQISTSSGDVDLQKCRGDLTVVTVSGDLKLLDVDGNANVRSASGDVEMDHAAGTVTAHSVSGKVHINGGTGLVEARSSSDEVVIRNAKGRIDAGSISGNIRLLDVESSDVQAKTASGDVHYAGSLQHDGRYNFESLSGTLTIVLPAKNCGFNLEAKTFSGEIDTDFNIQVTALRGTGRGRRLEGSSGDGCARVKASTFSGNVLIRSSDGSREQIKRNRAKNK